MICTEVDPLKEYGSTILVILQVPTVLKPSSGPSQALSFRTKDLSLHPEGFARSCCTASPVLGYKCVMLMVKKTPSNKGNGLWNPNQGTPKSVLGHA